MDNRQRKIKWVWVLLAILTGIFLYGIFKQPKSVSLLSDKESRSLKEVIEDTLAGANGTYGIAVKSLKTNESYYFNEKKSFESGSLYKLWIMATVFKQIQDGILTEDEVLSEDVATLNNIFNIDPDSAELTEGVVTLTVSGALSQMITISHNYAALLLTEKVKLSQVASFLKENGFSESSVGTEGDAPQSTPSDVALFYEKLYQMKLANQQYTEEMIDLLRNQKLNDGLPKYLPDQSIIAGEQSSERKPTVVIHKTGDIGWFKHDAGIVYTDKGDYIIVIMSESDYPPGAQERIALISKAVYGYFTR